MMDQIKNKVIKVRLTDMSAEGIINKQDWKGILFRVH
jgi:DNA-binding HxlR family transcriptional regulator